VDEDEDETALLYRRDELLSQCDGDEELMSELVSIFHDDMPQIVQASRETVEKHDALALAAHAPKLLSSSLGAFGAGRARTLTHNIAVTPPLTAAAIRLPLSTAKRVVAGQFISNSL
jgi:hypothetical protein